MKMCGVVLAILLLAGCSGRPAPVVSEPPGAPQTPDTPKPVPDTPKPVSEPPRLTFTHTADEGFRLETENGSLGALQWEGPDRFTFAWFAAADSPPTLYMADLRSSHFQRLGQAESARAFVHPSGNYSVVVSGDSTRDLRVQVVQVETGAAETVFALDKAVPQWAAESDRHWAFGEVGAAVDLQWMNQQTVLLTLTPQDQRNIQTWGKVLQVDLARKQVRVLVDRGRAFALPGDGLLEEAALVQSGWVDGPLTVALSDGANRRSELSPAGLWKWSPTPGTGEPVIAWLELEPPPGDWSDRLPHACCSGDPHPKVRTVALWHRAGGWVRRFPAPAALPYERLFVLRDGSVLYAAAPDADGVGTDIYRVDLEGRHTRLARHEWRGRFHLHAELPDGSLYYTLTGRSGQNPSTLVRRLPDGRTEALWEGLLESVATTGSHLILNVFGQPTTFVDLKSGKLATGKLTTGKQGRPSPDGKWALSGGLADEPRTVRVSPIKP